MKRKFGQSKKIRQKELLPLSKQKMKKGNNNVNRTKSLKKMKKINTSSTNQSERNYSK